MKPLFHLFYIGLICCFSTSFASPTGKTNLDTKIEERQYREKKAKGITYEELSEPNITDLKEMAQGLLNESGEYGPKALYSATQEDKLGFDIHDESDDLARENMTEEEGIEMIINYMNEMSCVCCLESLKQPVMVNNYFYCFECLMLIYKKKGKCRVTSEPIIWGSVKRMDTLKLPQKETNGTHLTSKH